MPALLIAALLLVGMALPTLTHESPFPIAGDLITDIYLFAIFRFFFSLAGLDSGSMFAGIGARRELTLGILVEPILVLACFIMAMMVAARIGQHQQLCGHPAAGRANRYSAGGGRLRLRGVCGDGQAAL